MCEHQHGFATRRGLFSWAGGALALSTLPGTAWAAGHADALGFTCIDYRVVDEAADLFNKLGLTNDYDMLALAGASLAAVSPVFPSSNAAFWDQLALAKKLHEIKKVVIVDHRDCGAYKAAFGEAYADGGEAELLQHKGVMVKVQTELSQKYPELALEGYLLSIEGVAERVI